MALVDTVLLVQEGFTPEQLPERFAALRTYIFLLVGLWTLPGVLTTSECGSLTKHRIRAANFDDDGDYELMLAYWAADGTIRITVYDVDENLDLRQNARLSLVEVEPPREDRV